MYHFFPFRPEGRILPRLDFGLCKAPLGGSIPRVALPALDGLSPCFGTSGSALSLSVSAGVLSTDEPSSSWLCGRCARLAFSCTFLNFSSSSAHLIAPSSRDLSRFDLSKGTVGVWGVLPNLASVLFCRTWDGRKLTYVRGAI